LRKGLKPTARSRAEARFKLFEINNPPAKAGGKEEPAEGRLIQ